MRPATTFPLRERKPQHFTYAFAITFRNRWALTIPNTRPTELETPIASHSASQRFALPFQYWGGWLNFTLRVLAPGVVAPFYHNFERLFAAHGQTNDRLERVPGGRTLHARKQAILH